MSRPPLLRRASQRLIHAFVGAFWGLKVSGLEHVPMRGPVIIASNHVSWWDGPVLILGTGSERYLRFLTKAEIFRVPALGWFLKQVGMLPLDRKADVSAIRSAVDFLHRDGMLGLFPEGTRSKTGLPGRPKAGVGFLARESGAPVIPARLINTDKSLSFRPFEVRFGPALRFPEIADAGREQCQAFSQAVMDRIFSL